MQSEAFRSEKRKRNMENTYHCYANRELSWLRFNERVLEEAEDSRLPLCERLSFLSIFQSNLDEFFMVRIGSLQDQMLLDKNARENKTNMTSGEQIDAALAFIHKLTARRDAAYNGLLEQLAEQGIRLLDFAHMEEESRTELEKLFRQDYLPLLSSFIISKKQAFPFLKNKGIYAVAVLSTKAEKKKIGIVPCGNEIFPRLVPVPGRTGCFILSEELILHFLPLLYKGYKVTSKTLARITRNADIDADLIYDEDLNYRDHMAEVVKKRKKLAPVRLELSREIDEEIIQSLCKNLKLDPKRVFEYDSPLDHSFLFQIEDQLRSHTDLFFAPRHPQPSPALDERKPIIPQILEEDKLIHYPYESIRPFLQLLHEAACDPDVVSIKMTLYRLANHSKVVDALVEAAENGKQVDVLVELKARFDEENNIEWSRLLERAGCHVVYPMEDFWKSVQTIQAERGADYRAFSLFSATHWAELLGAAAVIFLCAVIYYRCREVTRHQILRAVFVLMLADEFMKQAVLLYTGQWNVTYLPLHLCSINIFVCWYDAIHQSRWSKEILYALCIPGAVVAMLSPSWQRLPVWNLLHLHSYSIHVLLILYPVLLLAGGFRPQVHHIRWVLAFLCAIATPIFFLNRLLKTNFFFLNDPQGNAITAFFAHCFGERFYLLGFLPVLAAVLLLLYLPWYRAERHQRMLCARDQVIA